MGSLRRIIMRFHSVKNMGKKQHEASQSPVRLSIPKTTRTPPRNTVHLITR